MTSSAQDVVFSQFYNTPIYANPANTGRFEQDIRFGLIHRNQWQSLGSPYQSTMFSADMNFYKNPLKADRMGAGLLVLNDETPDGVFKTQQILLSGSFHQALDDEDRHKFSFGLQAGVGLRSQNPYGRIFGDMINPTNNQFDQTSKENLTASNIPYLNINTGVNYEFVASDKVAISIGLAAHNLTMPKEGYTDKRLSVRWSVILGMSYKITPKLTLMPSVYYTSMASAPVLMPGANVAYSFLPQKSKNTFIGSVGVWYQAANAAVVYGGLRFNNVQVGMSYDFTASSQTSTVQYFGNKALLGAWEISLVYVGFLKRGIPSEVSVPCKIF